MRAMVVLILVACGSSKSSKPEATVALFGTKPVPPGRLAKVKAGMTQAEVKALYPDIRPTPNHSGSPSLTVDSDYANAEYRIIFYEDIDAVADVEVSLPAEMKIGDALRTSWGKPESELGGILSWVNEDDGYEGEVWDMGRHALVRFKPFTPLTAAFFGTSPGPFGALAKLSFGMTRAQVTAAVPGMQGPPAGGGSYIPYDAKVKGVTMDVRFADDERLERMSLRMPTRGEALLTKAWGPATVKGDVHCWWSADKATEIALFPGPEPVSVELAPAGKGFCGLR